VRLLVETLGEDPRGAAEILHQRAASGHSFLREELRQMSKYLHERVLRP
jgi:hypothetical protein